MFAFFDSISTTISIVVSFVCGLIDMVIFFFTAIPKALVILFEYVALMPTVIQTFVYMIISITVILQIMNKGS